MRLGLVFALASFAGSETQPWERLEALKARTETTCAQYSLATCNRAVPPQEMVDCMNAALASGAVAETEASGARDSRGFSETTLIFAADAQVEVFIEHPDGDETHGGSFVEEGPRCPGPFYIATSPCPYAPGTTAELRWNCQ